MLIIIGLAIVVLLAWLGWSPWLKIKAEVEHKEMLEYFADAMHEWGETLLERGDLTPAQKERFKRMMSWGPDGEDAPEPKKPKLASASPASLDAPRRRSITGPA